MADVPSTTTPFDAARRLLARALGFGTGHGSGSATANWDTFGWPLTVGPYQMWSMYLRNGVAHRIVRAFPQATWREQPLVRDEEGSSESRQVRDKLTGEMRENPDYSSFVESVGALFRKHNVLRYMERVDRLASLGQFGVLFLGFRDGRASEPLATGDNPLLYLAAYGEPNVRIASFDEDPMSERYGLPETYNLSSGQQTANGKSKNKMSFVAHHSRVIHVAEVLEQDEVYGTPTLLPIFNLLLDLEKVTGSSAESFWYNSRGGMALTADKDAKLSPDDLNALQTQADEFENQLRRIMAMRGVTAHMLTTSIADPGPVVDRILDQIAGAKGMPKRILIGSERGELASSQDENNWAARVDERQNNFASPAMVVPFVQKMIDTGNVDQPEGEFWVEWSDSGDMSPGARADYATKMAQAIATYTNAMGGEELVPYAEYRSEVLGLTPTSEYASEEAEEDLDETDPEVDDQFGGEEDPSEAGEDAPAVVTNLRQYRRAAHRNARPRTLYVRRNVLNAEELHAHFASQGVGPMTPAEEMHVTIAYSRTPLDWSKIEPLWVWGDEQSVRAAEEVIVPEGGMRMMELFGKTEPRRFLVLQFSSSQLSHRHEMIKLAGASWDFSSYEPHVSITADVAQSWGEPEGYLGQVEWEQRLRDLEPWRGRVVLGPEIWSELDEGWKDRLVENREAAE